MQFFVNCSHSCMDLLKAKRLKSEFTCNTSLLKFGIMFERRLKNLYGTNDGPDFGV